MGKLFFNAMLIYLLAQGFALSDTDAKFEFLNVKADGCISEDEKTFYSSLGLKLGLDGSETKVNLKLTLQHRQYLRTFCSADLNTIVGQIIQKPIDGGRQEPIGSFIWTAPDSFSLMGTPDAGFFARGVTKDGSIIYGYLDGEHAFMYTTDKLPILFSKLDPIFFDTVNTAITEVEHINGKIIISGYIRRGANDPWKILHWNNGDSNIISKPGFQIVGNFPSLSPDGESIFGRYKKQGAKHYQPAIVKGQELRVFSIVTSFAADGDFYPPFFISKDEGFAVAPCYLNLEDRDEICLFNKQGAVRPLWDLLIYEYKIPSEGGGNPSYVFEKNGIITIYGRTRNLVTPFWKVTFPNPNLLLSTDAISGPSLPNEPQLLPSVQFSEQFDQTSEDEYYSGYSTRRLEENFKSNFSIKVNASLAGFDLSQVSGASQVNLKLGDFDFSAQLSDASGYRKGKTSASFAIYDNLQNGRKRKIGSIVYQWNKNILKVIAKVNSSTTKQIATKKFSHWDGNIDEWINAQVSLGNASGTSRIHFKGRNSTNQKRLANWKTGHSFNRIKSLGKIKTEL